MFFRSNVCVALLSTQTTFFFASRLRNFIRTTAEPLIVYLVIMNSSQLLRTDWETEVRVDASYTCVFLVDTNMCRIENVFFICDTVLMNVNAIQCWPSHKLATVENDTGIFASKVIYHMRSTVVIKFAVHIPCIMYHVGVDAKKKK